MEQTENRVGLAVNILSHQIKRHIDNQIAQLGITGVQGRIIHFIFKKSQHEDVFQKDIEKAFEIRRASATGILKLMEKNGIIIKEAVFYDARLKKIILTEKALKIQEQVTAGIQAMERQLAENLSEEEVRTLLNLLGKIAQNIK